MSRVVASCCATLLLAACTGGGTSETTLAATVPSTAPATNPCSLLTLDEAATLIAGLLTVSERPGVCSFAGDSGLVLLELIDAPGGPADLAAQRRTAEDAFGTINVRTVENLGDAAYLVEAGAGPRIQFVVGTVIATLSVAQDEPVSVELVTRTEEMARIVAGRL